MSGELQTIPARHGVATFVPRGRNIKVINTYGKQVVSMWAFTLGPPPEEEEEDEEGRGEEEVKKEAEEVKGVVEGGAEGKGKGAEKEEGEKEEEKEEAEEGKSAKKESEDTKKEDTKEKSKEKESLGKESQDTTKEEGKAEEEHEDPPEQAPDTPENEKTTQSTESAAQQPSKRTWSSYLPSIPYRNKGKAEKGKEPNAEEEKAQTEENTKRWSSYLPTGKAISSYVPNVQLPDSKNVVSAFKATHPRDPNKSYAEQLYDFSKTPVGAGTIAAATGSGYASSVYAAYSAYTSTSPFRSSQPPMEFLSLPHTRASSYKLVPEVNDELLTNLRNPIITLIEDTTPGAHDTLTAACDANLYTALGVDKPEEHGSCAENLVIALKELNESAGLKGAKAIGADVSVNVAPTPLHLFMNAPLQTPSSSKSEDDGVGAKGTTVKVAEPSGKKRSFVRFRAERDVVIVFSACPMDIGPQNGGRCMAANFMVEDVQEGEDLSASVASLGKKKAPKKISKEGAKKEGDKKKEVATKEKGEVKKEEPKKAEKKEEKPLARRDSGVAKPNPPARKASEKKEVKKEEKPKAEIKKEENPKPQKEKPEAEKEQPRETEQQDEDAKPAKKKPKKLQVRSKSSQNVTKTAS